MEKRIFGFDIGIASIGWSVIDFDDMADFEHEIYPTGRIIKAGARCFPQAENPDGSSLASDRRKMRLSRKLIRRKARRMAGIKALFVAKGLIDGESLSFENPNNIYRAGKGITDVWELRVKALSEKLTNIELIRVLTHLAKHRGFKSYRIAAEQKDAEAGKVLKAVDENKKLTAEGKTLAQIFVERGGKKRNKKGSYENSIPREEIIRETRLIFEKQRALGQSAATKDLQRDFEDIAFRFRPVSSVEKMLGKCLFEKDEPRAPKEAPGAEFFVAWTKINNCTVYENAEKRFLTPAEKQVLFDLLKMQKKVTYEIIRKKLFKGKENITFADIEYNPKPRINKKTGEIKEVENPESKEFYSLKGYHTLKSTIDISELPLETLDRIVSVIAVQKSDKSIEEKLAEIKVSETDIEKLKQLNFKTFLKLSLKAIYKLLPEMRNGKKYNEACELVGYDFKSTGKSFSNQKGEFLPAVPEEMKTGVPVVDRSVAQFRKVYNAMVRRFGKPDQVNVELAREVYHTVEERKDIEKRQQEYAEEKETARKLACDELKTENISGRDLLKFRLYKQQDGKCIYSGKALDLRRLTEQDYCDVDHIIPYSRSFDDSMNNKVLCLSRENRQKSNKTPLEYITDPVLRAEFIARVNSMKGMRKAKKSRLLMRAFNDKEMKFKDRNLNDTRYMARYIMQYLDECIDFSDSQTGIKDHVQARNGALTDFLRHQWGLKKNRGESDIHHAMDAIVIACATNGFTQYLAFLSKIFENKEEYAKKQGKPWYTAFKKRIKQPWEGFYQEVQDALSTIFVSRPPRKKATGAVHKATVYSEKQKEGSLPLRFGKVEKDNMFRCDVFKKDGRYYVIPVYLADFVEKNRSDVFQPIEKDGVLRKPDETYRFLFSVYKGDYLKIENNEGETFEGYMKQYKALSGQFYIGMHDSSAGYSLCSSSFEINDILVLPVKGQRIICRVSAFNSETQKLSVVSVDTGEVFEVDACAKINKKGEIGKTYKTTSSYEKLDKEKTIKISTFKRLRKYQVDPLGNRVEVKSEKRLPLNLKQKKRKKS